jgi:HSP20 family protein
MPPQARRTRRRSPERLREGYGPPLPPWGYYGPPPWVRFGPPWARYGQPPWVSWESLGDVEEDPGEPRVMGSWTPAVDIEETDDAWIIQAELPGVSREDVSVEARGDELYIRAADREGEREGGSGRRRGGRFDYHVQLPVELDVGSIEATLTSGVLTIRVPRTLAPQSRQIEVQ